MYKKVIALLSILTVFNFICYAHGEKDVEEIEVKDMQSWQESFDLSGKKAGKYNILVTASDLGGNTTLEGPYNLYLDPKSDLPVCGITNPLPGMRIIGNLNIVGTCVDDDSVEHVDLVLDGDEANPIRASGKEFWSYYLDTTKLEEGPHTIKVVGYDVNGLVGEPVSLTWNLDRRVPSTAVNNYSMGTLVSKVVKFHGTVEDGNGIKSLTYSIDNGKTFSDVKLKSKKGKTSKDFEVSVDTRKLNDGASVIWFKAKDITGSTGIYSFLYFVDNTSPDVKIIQPDEKDVVYGKIGVAGFAKDDIGIASLHWEFGNQKGEFELIPGNPYWAKTFDLAGITEKSRKFTIIAKDIAGNVVTVSRDILIDEERDKPVVTIDYPTSSTFIETTDSVYVRGIAADEDGIQSVKYKLDNGSWIEEETKGVFCGELAKGSDLNAGNHTITVVAKDRHGVESNSFSVSFSARGKVPEFKDAKIGNQSVVNGISVHPEAGLNFQVSANSSIGLKSVHVETTWGKDGKIENDFTPNGASSQLISIPINETFPQGVAKIYIVATDTADRSSEYRAMLDIVNTSVITAPAPEVVFDNSSVSADGVIINNKEFPASGYFIGGNAKSVEIVPKTAFATAKLEGNSIILVPGDAIGSSSPVVVRVTTDQGLTYDSRQLIFKNDTAIPSVKISQAFDNIAIEPEEGAVNISGTVSCATGIGALYYKVYSARAQMNAGVLTGLESVSVSAEKPLPAERTFNISEEFGYGVFVIEVIAESAGGNKASAAIGVKNIPVFPANAKGGPKPPVVAWADGLDVYYITACQSEADKVFGVFKREEMTVGANPLTLTVSAGGKTVTSKYTASRPVEAEAAFALIDEEPYSNGKIITLNKEDSKKLIGYIDTKSAEVTASYEISGEKVPGGAEKQSGIAVITKTETEDRYKFEIPLANLPVRMNNVKLSIKAGSYSKEIKGTVGVIRSEKPYLLDDKRALYGMPGAGVEYNSDNAAYIMKTGDIYNFYANTPEIVSAELLTAYNGVEVSYSGNNVSVKAVQDGIYTGIGVRVKDINGASYSSSTVKLIIDSGAPDVTISTPELHSWVKNSIRLTGTAADPSGIKSGDYSIDGGVTWLPLSLSFTGKSGVGATYSATINSSNLEDGLVKIDVRIFDIAGNVSYARTAAFKDTTVPSVTVVLPDNDAIVNGENLIAFNVRDNGSFEKAFYIAPPVSGSAKVRKEIENDKNFVMTYVGTKEMPIDDAMSFEFVDDAGNVALVEAWKFIIDSQSDLPIAEIHLPVENEVITRDFTVSGVVYDDDGESTIYYRIDKGEYIKMPEAGTSFAIDIPLDSMADNEHSIFVYAVDINGVKGPETERKIRVSKEEPKGAVEFPVINTSNKGVVTIKGVASDKNGIEKVLISLDNGNSYNNVIGTDSWSYTFDSRAIPNGTNVIFFKVFDKYGIQGLYSSLINIDNASPEMVLDYPLDYSSTAGPLFFSGYAFDNVNITELFVSICSLDGKVVPKNMQRIDFKLERIIAQDIDISSLENGSYNIELTALDKAENATHISRNIMLNKNKPLATVNLLYPLNGEHKQGEFNIYGNAEADKKIENLSLYIDDKFVEDTKLTESDYFVFNITADKIEPGVHTYRVDARVEGGKVISSRNQTVEYSSSGPWVKIDNFNYGDFAIERPYIRGSAGYSLDGDETEIAKMKVKNVSKEHKAEILEKKILIEAKKVEKIELSFDNGKTFTLVSKGEKWMYRVENEDLAEGYHFMLVRATMKNGETAIERTIIQIDNTSPKIRLISPSQGGRYNQELEFSGLTSDDIGLKNVKLSLRKGDKSSYEVPSFIQGLYLDWHFWGATLFDIGVGLTFFDDAVKIQFQWGQFTQAQRDMFSKTDMRYGGDNVMGVKILANVAQIPFSYFLGHDWEWLSASAAVGAQFSYFNESGSEEGQILSALLAQIEFPKVTFSKMKMFSSFSAYSEVSVWFIPSDVTGGNVDIDKFVPQFSEGIRVSIF